jgi:hypothetical protein
MRKNFVSIKALLPSECQWVFHYSLYYVFPKVLGVATSRCIKRVSEVNTQWCHIRTHLFIIIGFSNQVYLLSHQLLNSHF